MSCSSVTHALSCIYSHNDPLLDNCLNDLLSLPLSLSLSLTLSPSPLCWLTGGVLLSETHTSSDTWLTAGDGRGERECGTDIHAQKEKGSRPSVVSPLLFCSCAGVRKRFTAPSGLQKHKESEIRGFFLHRMIARAMFRPHWYWIRPLGLLLWQNGWYPSWIFCCHHPPQLSLVANEPLLERKRRRCLWTEEEPYSCYLEAQRSQTRNYLPLQESGTLSSSFGCKHERISTLEVVFWCWLLFFCSSIVCIWKLSTCS